MTDHTEDAGIFLAKTLSTRHPTPVSLTPDAAVRAEIAKELGINGIRKLTFTGQLIPVGRRGWRLEAKLGATVVQECIVTLAPVATRIDTPVVRQYEPLREDDVPESGSEIEMPEDDTIEPLGESIDASAAMTEALALALPLYPRAADAPAGDIVVAEPGVKPLTDDDIKPFAGLAGLRDKLKREE